MKLLVFAHRREASTFIKFGGFKPQDFVFEGLFKSSDSWLLLCGEGKREATQKLSIALGALPEVTEVVNFGVAGSLTQNLELGKIIAIRTIYGESEFHSFTTEHSGEFDLITANDRVLELAVAQKLESFAPIVDREAHALASVCRLLKKPFSCYKLLSDYAGETKEICKVVKEAGTQFSDELYEFSLSLNLLSKNKVHFDETKVEWEGLHFSLSMKRNLEKSLRLLQLKSWDGSLEEIVKEVQSEDLRPKDKAQLLLRKLDELARPFQSQINSELNELASVFEHGNFRIKFDPMLESTKFELTAKVEHPKHINDLITALEGFNYNRLVELFEGNIDKNTDGQSV